MKISEDVHVPLHRRPVLSRQRPPTAQPAPGPDVRPPLQQEEHRGEVSVVGHQDEGGEAAHVCHLHASCEVLHQHADAAALRVPAGQREQRVVLEGLAAPVHVQPQPQPLRLGLGPREGCEHESAQLVGARPLSPFTALASLALLQQRLSAHHQLVVPLAHGHSVASIALQEGLAVVVRGAQRPPLRAGVHRYVLVLGDGPPQVAVGPVESVLPHLADLQHVQPLRGRAQVLQNEQHGRVGDAGKP
mmetsp:Transcript_16208/g.35909  ORF Transcript_16208/g.35909 Transcript_16208/m.35909 type:complete len:246 (-) Transcript_16208:365-1102(-)